MLVMLVIEVVDTITNIAVYAIMANTAQIMVFINVVIVQLARTLQMMGILILHASTANLDNIKERLGRMDVMYVQLEVSQDLGQHLVPLAQLEVTQDLGQHLASLALLEVTQDLRQDLAPSVLLDSFKTNLDNRVVWIVLWGRFLLQGRHHASVVLRENTKMSQESLLVKLVLLEASQSHMDQLFVIYVTLEPTLYQVIPYVPFVPLGNIKMSQVDQVVCRAALDFMADKQD
jgi:hypothetical protein